MKQTRGSKFMALHHLPFGQQVPMQEETSLHGACALCHSCDLVPVVEFSSEMSQNVRSVSTMFLMHGVSLFSPFFP